VPDWAPKFHTGDTALGEEITFRAGYGKSKLYTYTRLVRYFRRNRELARNDAVTLLFHSAGVRVTDIDIHFVDPYLSRRGCCAFGGPTGSSALPGQWPGTFSLTALTTLPSRTNWADP